MQAIKSVGGTIGNILGLQTQAPPLPTLAATPAAPTMNMSMVSQAAQASIAAQVARQGRASTILSGTSSTDQKLGG